MPKNSYYVSSFSLFDELPSLFGNPLAPTFSAKYLSIGGS